MTETRLLLSYFKFLFGLMLGSFAQWRYSNQWSNREVLLLLVENYTQYPAISTWNTVVLGNFCRLFLEQFGDILSFKFQAIKAWEVCINTEKVLILSFVQGWLKPPLIIVWVDLIANPTAGSLGWAWKFIGVKGLSTSISRAWLGNVGNSPLFLTQTLAHRGWYGCNFVTLDGMVAIL